MSLRRTKPLQASELRQLFDECGDDARRRYAAALAGELTEFFTGLGRAYNLMEEAATILASEKRAAWVDQFLFGAFNALFTSVWLLMSGLGIQAGHMMRHFGEGLAMALLCSHPQISTFTNFERNPPRYAVHKALTEVLKKRNAVLLRVDRAAWQEFVDMISFYDVHSHPTAFAAATLHVFDQPGMRQIGGEYDSEKLEVYRGEMRRAISACSRLEDAVRLSMVHLHTGAEA